MDWPHGAYKRVGIQRAFSMAGLVFDGSPHSGEADAYNATRLEMAVAEWSTSHAESGVHV